MFDSTDKNYVQDFLRISYQKVDPKVAYNDFVRGGQQGAVQANQEASFQKDIENIIPTLEKMQETIQYAKQSITSDEIGPYDDKKMQAYYENLLRLQGRYEELGRIQGKDWNETQRAIATGNLLAPIRGAFSQGAKVVSKTIGKGESVAHKETPNINSSTNAGANVQVGDGDLPNVDSGQSQQVIKSEPDYQNIRYGHNVYDESFRTVAADREGQKVIQAMEGVVSSKYSQTVNIMLHQDGTVSVGLSGNLGSSKTLARIQATQQALDKKYRAGKYIVSTDTLNGTQGLKKVDGSNEVGTCAEPKCSVAAKDNPSPVTGFAIMWRGRGDNPYPIKQDEAKDRGLSSSQMYMCATCEFNKEIYEQYINNSSKK